MQTTAAALELQHSLPAVLQGKAVSHLLLLANAVQFRLPDALTQLASQNGISLQQLQQLASRPQGYPLPPLTVNKRTLSFSEGVSLSLPPDVKLPQGQYLARVITQGQTLLLQLQPVISRQEVTLSPHPSLSQPPESAPLKAASATAPRLITKADTGNIISQWLKTLEQLPLTTGKTAATAGTFAPGLPQAQPQGATPSTAKNIAATAPRPALDAAKPLAQGINRYRASATPHTTDASTTTKNATPGSTSQQMPGTLHNAAKETVPPAAQQLLNTSGLNYLQKAFNKLGAVPRGELRHMALQQNVASALLKQLPHLQAKPLSHLALPDILQAELSAFLRFQPTAPSSTGHNTQTDGISTLLQLLIGVKAIAHKLPLSTKLRQYLQTLQNRSGIGPQLLQTLQEQDALEHVSRMSQGIRLYQQAGADSIGQCWYATLPYYLDQRQEQLEAKFEYLPESDNAADKRRLWQLQLKFNLSDGSLLAKARLQPQGITLHFIGSQQQLVDKLKGQLAPLSKKLTQLGLPPREISAHVAPVPATLLPGDHYLVQMQA
ncbi:hypothetical protein [Shewanella sp. YIC-542]|uniref:hypothetical protein n=1 Tax=Shewanella mytili TaxID=3377111 RepID=UPI00398E783B